MIQVRIDGHILQALHQVYIFENVKYKDITFKMIDGLVLLYQFVISQE